MPFLAKGIRIYKRKNRWKDYFFRQNKKAKRFWEKVKRKGFDAQLIY